MEVSRQRSPWEQRARVSLTTQGRQRRGSLSHKKMSIHSFGNRKENEGGGGQAGMLPRNQIGQHLRSKINSM